MYIDSLNI